MEVLTQPFKDLAHWASHRRVQSVYDFEDGGSDDIKILGRNGTILCEMTRMKLPVPPGFIITTETYEEFLKEGNALCPDAFQTICKAVHRMESEHKLSFGPSLNSSPLLFSVRAGTQVVIPGITKTILNVGMNDSVVKQLIDQTSNPIFPLSSFVNYLKHFGELVLKIPRSKLDSIAGCDEANASSLPADRLGEMIIGLQAIVKLPESPLDQLKCVLEAIYAEWSTPKSQYLRESTLQANSCYCKTLNLLPSVIVQMQVHGDYNGNSGCGILYSRDPITGENELRGEFLYQSTGMNLCQGTTISNSVNMLKLNHSLIYDKVDALIKILELRYRDMQCMEFIVQDGRLFILGASTGKRSAMASVRIATDMVRENLITEREAILRQNPKQLLSFNFRTSVISSELNNICGFGVTAAAGFVTGEIVFNCFDAQVLAQQGRSVILVKNDMSVDDFDGMIVSVGVLTMNGGTTSYASSHTRSLEVPTIVGASRSGMTIDTKRDILYTRNKVELKKGEVITLDGASGMIFLGYVPTVDADKNNDYQLLLSWADKYKKMGVFTTASNSADVAAAILKGTDGIGVYSIEEMFKEEKAADTLRLIIIASCSEDKLKYQHGLEKLMKKEFMKIFELIVEKRFCLQLLGSSVCSLIIMNDAELSLFFLRNTVNEIEKSNAQDRLHCLCDTQGCTSTCTGFRDAQRSISGNICEVSGSRCSCYGCNIFAVEPDINKGILIGVFDALNIVRAKSVSGVFKFNVQLPTISSQHEIDALIPVLQSTIYAAQENSARDGLTINVGACLEVPRCCLKAEKVIKELDLDFVSFGTDRLTELMFGIKKNESKPLINAKLLQRIWTNDPFEVIDKCGVGYMIARGIESCSKSKFPDLKIGAHGVQCGDPDSIKYLSKLGVNYISVPPNRVFCAKISSAQTSILDDIAQEEFFDVEDFPPFL